MQHGAHEGLIMGPDMLGARSGLGEIVGTPNPLTLHVSAMLLCTTRTTICTTSSILAFDHYQCRRAAAWR